MLTHQFLAIEWARSVGCRVPDAWRERQEELAAEVWAEFASDRRFSDLFVERAAVVALAGRARELRPDWIEWILDAQRADGCWEAPPETYQIQFRGQTLVSRSRHVATEHTSSLAVCALTHYVAAQ